MASDYLPDKDAEFVVWLNNFNTKIPGYAATFSLVAGDTTAVANDYAAINYMVNQVELSKVNTQDRVAYKDLIKNGPIGATGGAFPGAFTPPAAPGTTVLPGVTPRIRLLAKRIKAHPAYTVAVGEDLGIVRGHFSSTEIPKPTGSARALIGSEVQIKFVKKGFDGVFVESKRGAETAWSTLGTYIRSPFVDNRAPLSAGQPEVRNYRMVYVKGNEQTGDVSDVLVVTTMP